MGIYIKGMEMPKGHSVCIVIDAAGQAQRYDLNNDRYADDKLFEAVPAPPHGRLIDADELKKVIASAKYMDAHIYDGKIRTMYSDHLCVGADYDDVCAAIDETPTIITAEEGE